MVEYQWSITTLTPEQQDAQARLERELNISAASARMLVVRGVETAEAARAFVRPSLDRLPDPMLMRDMDKAVERLTRAVAEGENILIYGDYDVDGTTAVALMYRFLRPLTEHIDYYIPDRYTEGYGISFRGIDYAEEHHCSLIVALDCGIKAVDKVEYANSKGIDFIICDHHTPGDTLPQAVAVLNMKRADCAYPYKELSGCGVGFKLAQAYTHRHHLPQEHLVPLLQLLAMSIASDIVPITGENRILAYFGIRQLNRHPFAGLTALMEVAGIEQGRLNINDLVYKIGPRINASGRMKSGSEAVSLLITDDLVQARQQASDINTYNTERHDCDTETTRQALDMLAADPDNAQKRSTVVYSPEWHKGVVGIVASRLTESYYRPTIVLTAGENGIISGSARSVGGFDIYSAIDSCRDLLTNFGGHVFAAGLSMKAGNLDEFRRRFEEYVRTHIREDQLQPTLHIEAEIQLADIDTQFFNILRHLEPFGPGNPRPVFVTRRLINNRSTRAVGKNNEHLRLDVTDRTAAITGIAFGRADMEMHLRNGLPVDICYELDENTFHHKTTIQMMAQDIKLCSTNVTHKDLV